MKICIIGYSGSGKSSLAIKLGHYYQIAPTHLDKLNFEPGWVKRDLSIRNEMLGAIVNQDKWIIDGNYSSSVPERFSLADQIFIFKFNRFKCLYGAIVRRIKYHNKTRASMTEGNKERLDFGFLKWIMLDSRNKARRAIYKRFELQFPKKVIVFKKRKKVNNYLLSLGITDFKERA